MDFVFTVCDQAAGESARLARQSRHRALGRARPAAVEGSEAQRRQAFRDAYRQLETRIKLFAALPLDKLDRMAVKREVEQIGRLRRRAARDRDDRDRHGGRGCTRSAAPARARGAYRAGRDRVPADRRRRLGDHGREAVAAEMSPLALLANAIATGGALVALILAFGPQSGAHMNPVVTLAAAATDGLRWHAVPAYIAAQIVGAIAGVWLAHVMFGLPVLQLSQHIRTGVPAMGRRDRRDLRPADGDLGLPRA